MMQPMRKKIIHIYAWTLSIGLLYFLWGKLTGLYIPCLHRLTTGTLCAGCGITHMFFALLRLDFAAAWHHNSAVLLLLAFWNLVAVGLFFGKPKFLEKPWVLYGLLALTMGVLFIFGIMRNLS